MITTVRGDGSVEPRQSADLILTEFGQPASDEESREVTMRTFFCSDCCENFEAGTEADTVHNCGEVTHKYWL